MQEQQKDHYGLLGIAPDSPEVVIRKAYRRLALKYHPDKNAGDANAHSNFKTLQEAYGVLIDSDSRRIYDQRREAWGIIPNEFLPRNDPPLTPICPPSEVNKALTLAAPKSKPPERKPTPGSDPETKGASRKAFLREKLEAERIRIEKEKREQEEAARLIEFEKLQALAAERIRVAREAAEEERRLDGERRQQARDQERFHRMASERIRAQREGEARKREVEDARRRREEELAENVRQSKTKLPKGISPNFWGEAEIDCLLLWKRENRTWAVIADKMNELFDSERSAMSCRRKYIKMERAGET